jgi:N-acetylneuraminic acid mutarotase
MNQARVSASAALLNNGKVLIAGGLVASGPTNSVELYDPASNSFASAASLPTMNTARSGATATLLANGKVLIAGGVGISGALDSVELYDSVSNSFAASTPLMNEARVEAPATLLPNGKVLIAGGTNSSASVQFDSVELYDPASNSFTPAASLPTMNAARIRATATLLPNGKVLIAGGFAHFPPAGSIDTVELYDPASNSFASAASLPTMNTARFGATAALLANGKVLIAGGVGISGTLDSVELYDSMSNSFAASTPLMNEPRTETTAILLHNGKVLIAGGVNSEQILASVELYQPASNSFASAASLPTMNTARFGATTTLLADGKVLIAGGIGNSGALDSVELYSP